MFESENQEVLDIVDDNDKVIGQINRGEMIKLKEVTGQYLRTVEILLQRPNGDIYLPRRSKEKKIAPGGLDLSAAGHIPSGESYEQGCIRETKEELGLGISYSDLIFIDKINPSSQLFYFRQLYLLRTDQLPRLSPEHTEAVWIAPSEIIGFIHNDVPTKETLIEDVAILLDFLKTETNHE